MRKHIFDARHQAAVVVNAGLTVLYWKLGDKIRHEVLGSERAGCGEQIVVTLSQQLMIDFGRGYSEKNLRCSRCSSPNASGRVDSHDAIATIELVPLPGLASARQTHAAGVLREDAEWGGSVRTLRGRTDSMLYERTALSRKPDEPARIEIAALHGKGEVGPALIQEDPYILEFLDLKDHHLERDFEDAILRELELFLLELGAGFSFVARQKRVQLDGKDFYINLLFYNRKLKRLVAVELKQGNFKAEYKGQMELYLR